VFDFELIKSLKTFLRKNDSIYLSENRLLRFLFRMRGIERGSFVSSLKNARLFLAFRDACALLAKKGVPVYFYNRVGLKKDGFQYSENAQNRMKKHLSFPLMYENIDKYEKDLKELFGDKYSKEYVKEIGRIPQVIQVGDYYCHEDCKSRYINVVNGKRITCFQPKEAKRTIHIYGRCGAFGYAVEDSETLPSQIQKILVENGINDIKVVNHGLWGGENDLIDSNFFKDSIEFGQNDIVVFYRMHFDKRIIAKLEQLGLWYHEITEDWHKYPEAKSCFYDKPGHMNAVGYRNAAKLIVKDLIKHNFKNKEVASIMLDGFTNRYLTAYLKSSRNVKFDEEIEEYLDSIKAKYPNDSINNAGAIVMNCNPFTFGHRNLVEFASEKVERLYIFVVEEDKSFFKFDDRIEMVRKGVSDLKNVVVIPSGKFIISAFTFPEYFMKDYVKEKNFDVSSDIQIFCKYISPALNIKTRFAGEEPFDPVTSNYNETMRKILPEYGMKFCEIPRFKTETDEVINATKVRELLKQKDLKKLKEFVPTSTLAILQEKYNDN
ncbi:MAG: adenylyltransferase/cytidyltransferase family protein, partial [Candidatus Riflebacteria bacterium]|nr:adenylyltransferase/cytidyltransferase family protein [Candidatus Riflebacteria bacterium]